jgi:tetratricopeptide (TPR) repeat protein
MILGCGCVTNNPPVSPQVVATITTPTPDAVNLHNSGFNAYIMGDYTTAIGFYNQSLALDPTNARTWVDKGNALLALNQTSAAVSSYDSALAIESDLADVWNSRGVALMDMGNYTGARDSFERALQIAPEYSDAQSNLNLVLNNISNTSGGS